MTENTKRRIKQIIPVTGAWVAVFDCANSPSCADYALVVEPLVAWALVTEHWDDGDKADFVVGMINSDGTVEPADTAGNFSRYQLLTGSAAAALQRLFDDKRLASDMDLALGLESRGSSAPHQPIDGRIFLDTPHTPQQSYPLA